MGDFLIVILIVIGSAICGYILGAQDGMEYLHNGVFECESILDEVVCRKAP